MAECIILAAGSSTRMGHPKALTLVNGEPALARMARTWREVMDTLPLVVMGEHYERVRRALPDAPVRWLVNPHPIAGRTGSLQLGLREARMPTVVVWPVDHPLATAPSLRALLATPGDWVVPLHAGRGGHPILLRSLGIAAVQSAPAATPLRDIPAAVGLEVARVAVDDAGILANLDRPGDLVGL